MKKMLLSVAVIATIGITSCGGGADACSCAKDAEKLGGEMMAEGADTEGLQAKLTELSSKCTEAAAKDPEAWAEALLHCK